MYKCRKDPRAVARNTHIMTNSFICRGPELWGELSQNTKESKSLSSFKKQMKTAQRAGLLCESVSSNVKMMTQ